MRGDQSMKHSRRFFLFVSCFLFNIAHAQGIYEVRHDTMNASGWFGGDNRPASARSVGVGQSVTIDTPIVLSTFSFFFTDRFDYAFNPDGFGHAVTLTLNVRDAQGAILHTDQVVVPDTFDGGWVTWSNLNVTIATPSQIILTTYLVGAFDINQYFTGHASDQFAGYADGVRYVKESQSDAQMEDWTDWITHSWDSAFRLTGTYLSTDVQPGEADLPTHFSLTQNYPNPFNPTTTITYSVPVRGYVQIAVYNVLGQEVTQLVSGDKSPGQYNVTLDAASLSSGIYFYILSSGGTNIIKRMMLMR